MPTLYWLDVSALLMAAVVLAALVLLVVGAGLATRLSRLFLVFVSIEIAWLVSSFLLRLSVRLPLGKPQLFGELVGLSLVLMGPSLLAFAAEYVDRRGCWIRRAIVGGVLFGLIAVIPLFTHRVLSNPRMLANGTTVVDVTPLGMAVAVVPLAFFAWALVLFWQARRQTGETYLALSVAVLLGGFVFGSVMNVPVPITSVTQTLSAALLGYGVVSRQLFNPLRGHTAALRREIAERVRSEEALSASEQRFRTIFDSVSDAIVVLELGTGRILDVNRGACEMSGYTKEELHRMTALEMSANTPPHTEAEARERLGRASAGEAQVFEWPLRDRAGRCFWVELGIGRAYVGSDERLLVTARDISERRQAQEQQRLLQARVFDAQKLESLGVLAGGIAHDFNNLLCGIQGFAEIAAAEAPADTRLAGRLHRIQDAAKRAADLCRQLLAYAGRGHLSTEPVDISGLVGEMAELVRTAITSKAELRLELAGGLPAVEGDAAQLTQIALNLIVNASEALGESGGEIVVSTGIRYCDQQALGSPYRHDELPDGDYVFLRVADTGAGMGEATLARLFDPFFTSKFAGRGLGLSAVLGIVRRHHGVIQVESRAGHGSVFTVLLPAAADALAVEREERSPAPAWRGSGTILVVDDEPAAREAARAMLEETGFDVLAADDGLAGVEVFRAHANAIVAVLLDLTMPRMGGEQALEAMRRIRPDVRVILMSGYSEEDVATRFAAAGRPNEFLEKPFRWADLSDKLRAVLA